MKFNTICQRIAQCLLIWGVCAGVWAQTLPSPHIKFNRAVEVFEFKRDGSMVTEIELEREAITTEGAQALTKYSYGFNTALEDLQLVFAYTLKKSGQKINVETDAISVQKGLLSAGFGMTIPQWEQRQLSYPSVEVGDRVVFKTIKTVRQPALKAWFSGQDFAWPSMDLDAMSWTVKAPTGMPIYISSSLNPSVSTTTNDMMVRTYTWSGKGKSIDANPANTRVSVPYVLVSTISRYEDIAVLFALQVAQKSLPNDELKKIVEKAIAGQTTDTQKAKALYDWVRKEIKYVALYMSNGGWEPHDVAHILQKRYGDCKDHVVMLYAMLKLAGINSEPVLVNTLQEYELDAIPTEGTFNHTILYIPALKRFVDPTSSKTPFEGLPSAISGKPVAVSDTQKGYLARVPSTSAADNTVQVTTQLKIASNGSAQGSLDIRNTGNAAGLLQDRLTQIPAGFANAAVAEILRSSNLRGTGTVVFPAVDRDTLVQTAHIELTVKDWLKEPSAGSAAAHPAINLPAYILTNMGSYAQDSREFGYACNAVHLKEMFDVQYDPQFKLSRLPTDTKLGIDGISFTASYQFADNRLRGERELVISQSYQYCSPQEYERRKNVMRQIVRHLRAPLLYAQE